MWELLKDYPNFAWILLFITVAGGLVKILIAHLSSTHSVKQKNLDMFLSIIHSDKEITFEDKFVVEQIFYSMYKLRLEYSLIMTILNSHFPSKSFELYTRVHHYIKKQEQEALFEPVKEYKNITIFKWKIYYGVNAKDIGLYLVTMNPSAWSFIALYHVLVNWPVEFRDQLLAFLGCSVLVTLGVKFGVWGIKYLNRNGIKYLDEFLQLQIIETTIKTNFKM